MRNELIKLIESKEDKIEFMQNEINQLTQRMNQLESNLIDSKSNILIKDKNSMDKLISKYISTDMKVIGRTFETYDLIFQYFKFMVKNFEKRLLKDTFNELLIRYGEEKVKNSFAIYAEFISKEENKPLHQKFNFVEGKTDESKDLIYKMLNQNKDEST